MTTFSVKLMAEELGKSLENLADNIENELNQEVADLAHAAYANIVAKAQSELSSTRQDYLNNLKFINLGGNNYLITLEGKAANATETGYSGFDMIPGMLNSDKTVQTGSRSGEKWVQTNKEGKKYAAVPIEKKPHSKEPKTSDLNAEIRRMTATGRNGINQKLTKVFKDEFGKPLTGKVATGESSNPILNQLTKYQHVSEKGRVSSIYVNYRMVSEDSKGWKHKGYSGIHAFSEAENWVEKELDKIIKKLL